MFAIEARKMGYRVHTFSPGNDTPTGHIADVEISADYNDLEKVEEFAKSVDVITYEFENVPSKTIETAAAIRRKFIRKAKFCTRRKIVCAKRLFLSENGFPVAPFRHIKTIDDLYHAVQEIGTPCVLKTAGFGYDGKGQSEDRIGRRY